MSPETSLNSQSHRSGTGPLLVIQPMVGIGDMVWHKPWLDEMIREREVILMAKPSSSAEAVMAEHEGLKIIPLHRAERGRKGIHDGMLGFFRMVSAIRKLGADEVFILHRSWRYGAATWLAGIPQRSGYGLGAQTRFLNRFKGLPKEFEGAHPRRAVECFAENLGFRVEDTHPRINVSAAEVAEAKQLVKDPSPLVVMGVGAADAERRWSPQRFAELLDLLAESNRGVLFALCGSSAEASLGQAVADAIVKDTLPPQQIFDQSVGRVIALLKHAVLYIGNDTSLTNISAAVGTPAIRIFASDLPVLDSPLIETIHPEDPSRVGVPGSIDDIQAERVADLARVRLDSLGKS